MLFRKHRLQILPGLFIALLSMAVIMVSTPPALVAAETEIEEPPPDCDPPCVPAKPKQGKSCSLSASSSYVCEPISVKAGGGFHYPKTECPKCHTIKSYGEVPVDHEYNTAYPRSEKPKGIDVNCPLGCSLPFSITDHPWKNKVIERCSISPTSVHIGLSAPSATAGKSRKKCENCGIPNGLSISHIKPSGFSTTKAGPVTGSCNKGCSVTLNVADHTYGDDEIFTPCILTSATVHVGETAAVTAGVSGHRCTYTPCSLPKAEPPIAHAPPTLTTDPAGSATGTCDKGCALTVTSQHTWEDKTVSTCTSSVSGHVGLAITGITGGSTLR